MSKEKENILILKSDILLLLTAIIWGLAFVAQRIGMDYIGPFTFNGVRFMLGGFSLIPLILINKRKPGVGRQRSRTGNSKRSAIDNHQSICQRTWCR